jgi:hypothetical protein
MQTDWGAVSPVINALMIDALGKRKGTVRDSYIFKRMKSTLCDESAVEVGILGCNIKASKTIILRVEIK